ncbi:MAG: helix-turn-helix domain-containing protein [Egibacteraceae bacterium]
MQRNGSTPSAEPVDRVAWTVPETARRLGIKRSAAYAYVKAGILPSIKLGGRLLIPAAAVLALVDQAMSQWGGPDAA